MKSVEFADYEERTIKLRKSRKKLLQTINTFQAWDQCETLELTVKIYPNWNKGVSLLEYVQQLGYEIGDQTMDYSRPISKINEKTFSQEEYVVLRALGYSENAIAKAMKKSKPQFDRYKVRRKFPLLRKPRKIKVKEGSAAK